MLHVVIMKQNSYHQYKETEKQDATQNGLDKLRIEITEAILFAGSPASKKPFPVSCSLQHSMITCT